MDSKNPIGYYTTHSKKYNLQIERLQKKITTLSTLRIIIFIATCVVIYFYYKQWQVAILAALVGAGCFIYVLSIYSKTKHKKSLYKSLLAINLEELKIASGKFQDRKDGLQFQDASHYYSLDIDLFGTGSFFQFINRTATLEGELKLSKLLKANTIIDIELKQEAIKELSSKTKWRQYYQANANMVEVETSAEQIVKWMTNYNSFLPSIMQFLPLGFSTISIALVLLNIFGVLPYQSILLYWLLFGLALTGIYVKRINILSVHTEKVKDTFRQYAVLLNLIENEKFTAKLLQDKQKEVVMDGESASQIVKKLSKCLDALDNRNNIIGAVFGNGLFLTDLKFSFQIEKWIESYASSVENWFKAVSFFDAYNSFGNFTYNHPKFNFPSITAAKTIIDAENLGHPLLSTKKRVDSNIAINNTEFFIVTGANMAGKSTFLRTIALHIVMANAGLPVCAKSSKYNPVKLITSMRTTDSLLDESSYFFSELKRLKFIVDNVKREPYFVVLDEILKGTNSTDKALGSSKFVKKLVHLNATGIIATHDLSLCKIAEELQNISNQYFDAEIINDELYFDYKLKKGVCKNMNASFLLKKMQII